MSLLVHLPLNGNLENKGLANVTVTNNGATVDNNGKIGKCYSFNGSNNWISSTINITDSMSFCTWVYFNSLGSSNGAHIMDARINDVGYLPIYVTSNTILIGENSGGFANSSYNFSLNTWYHICVVYTPESSYVYINGVKIASPSSHGHNYGEGLIIIGCRHSKNNYFLNGKLNDIRIYDHALSPKEVKEISKGLICHYKLDGSDVDTLLPYGLELYDYIQSSGTLWIDTGVIANLYPIEFKTNLCFTDDVTNEKDFFGNFNDGTSTNCFVCGKYSKLFYQWGGNAYRVGTVVLNQFYELSYRFNGASGRTLTIDGTVNTSTATNNFISRTNTLGMFSGASNKVYCAASVKMKYSLILINDVLVRNFLPCTYYGTPGMWDTVEGKFYRNNGTGLFTLGNKIILKLYEYLKGNGAGYIETEFIPSINTCLKFKFKEDSNSSNTYYPLIHASNSGIEFFTRANRNYAVYKGNAELLTTGPNTTNIIEVELKHNYCKANDTILTNVPVNNSLSPTISLPIFGYKNSQGNMDGRKGSHYLYYMLFYEDTYLVRDFIPCSYNGEYGLWDRVEMKFYGNAGTGSFTVGPEKTFTVYDSSGYGNNGTVTRTLSLSNNSPRYRYSTSFSGNSMIKSNDINLRETSNFTISCWVYRTGSQNYQPAFWFGNGNVAQGIAIHGPSVVRVEGGDGSNKFDVSDSGISADVWTHVVLTYNGNTITKYLNGIQKNTISYSNGFGNTLNRLYIGYFWGGYFNGKISDVRIYATALSDDDILELYNTSAFITDNGTFETYEFVEEDVNVDITKIGLVKCNMLYESDSNYSLTTSFTGSGSSQTPTNGINRCTDGYLILILDLTVSRKYIIELDFTWSGTWAFTSDGTASFNFQGVTRASDTGTWAWNGTNLVCSALNSKKSMMTLVTTTPTGGTYHYKTTFTVPANNVKNGFYLGTRCDYSDGNGSFLYRNLKIYPYEEYLDTEQTKIGDDYITSNNFIEI